jgi:GTP-binding protein
MTEESIITTAAFVASSQKAKQSPAPKLPEYAFIGRSNVGKSSLINLLTNNKKLAKTSSTPGKTRLINHFIINESWYLVDLPGYGFAKSSKKEIEKWRNMINEYLVTRKNLLNTFLLIDSRHEPQKKDLEFMEWMATKKLPFSLVFTKADKNSRNVLNKNLKKYEGVLLKNWSELPPAVVSSNVTKEGKIEILEFIEETNKIFR